ncbi:MAG: hypothetical protein WA982_10855 [Rubrobacteraceae bacterium]
MVGEIEKCAHLKGLQVTSSLEYMCLVCEELLDATGVERWVREAENARDAAYLMVEGDEFVEIAREESQQEVYRRRKLMYELQDIPRTAVKPEMLLVVHDERIGSYECRLFYKEPKPVWYIERLSIGASEDEILDQKAHSDPVIRLVAEKVLEFHEGREANLRGGAASARRVFYANEL